MALSESAHDIEPYVPPPPTRFSFHHSPTASIEHAIALAPSAVAMPPDWISRVNSLDSHEKMQLLIGYWRAGKEAEFKGNPNETLAKERDEARNERNEAQKRCREAEKFANGHLQRENHLDEKRRLITKCFAWTGGVSAATLIPAMGYLIVQQHHTKKTLRDVQCALQSQQSSQ